uniref:Uncharacterized protein n=1 Tax=Aegilops tauschii subsp. strangulata TaxID=200361 RepID=A0A453GVA9_AEGTS
MYRTDLERSYLCANSQYIYNSFILDLLVQDLPPASLAIDSCMTCTAIVLLSEREKVLEQRSQKKCTYYP